MYYLCFFYIFVCMWSWFATIYCEKHCKKYAQSTISPIPLQSLGDTLSTNQFIKINQRSSDIVICNGQILFNATSRPISCLFAFIIFIKYLSLVQHNKRVANVGLFHYKFPPLPESPSLTPMSHLIDGEHLAVPQGALWTPESSDVARQDWCLV